MVKNVKIVSVKYENTKELVMPEDLSNILKMVKSLYHSFLD